VLEQPQGSLCVLFGPHSRGKTTLCNVIGGFHLLPWDTLRARGADEEPCFFTPAHLRVVNVSGPLFFYGSLLENMTFGVALDSKFKRVKAICEEVNSPNSTWKRMKAVCEEVDSDDGKLARLKEICDKVNCPDAKLKRVQAICEEDDSRADGKLKRVQAICEEVGGLEGISKHLSSPDRHNWMDVFSDAECLVLAIVRALIANPNLLCIHKIIDRLDNEATARVLKALRKFIKNRGLEQGDHQWELVGRTQHTVFLTAKELTDTVRQFADYAYKIDQRIELVHYAEPPATIPVPVPQAKVRTLGAGWRPGGARKGI
jgi:ABC-type lipoprotein export system ATPase subunit